MSKPPRRRRAHWLAYLWPGLPHLWISGSLAGLALAVAFTVLLNVLILTTVVWPQWLAPQVQAACGVSVAVLWIAALVETRGELRRLALQRETRQQFAADPDAGLSELSENRRSDALLQLAQRHYLRAEWSDAERVLRTQLKRDAQDADAQLLLADVHRRMGRNADALRRLRRLSTKEEADRWRFEIGREVARLESASEAAQHEEAPRPAA
ncbi:hypothetical protein KOR34_38720 [Posidoniimonas corsicana]|uniref:Uncharacterized protein n=1 Tax=Posidoniimonas corsicana TaxID=1938618 RepID=A0A5C5V692_9BACT|nr:hypothetical protein [Posidoniimonas corsicana]TWT34036.1 hypothetical protein KOR34_38720 [Posidoniimonas corsicana]